MVGFEDPVLGPFPGNGEGEDSLPSPSFFYKEGIYIHDTERKSF
jgi:hypothetical protein